MARGNCTFRQRDVTAAVKAIVSAGVSVARVEIDRHGKIVVVASRGAEAVETGQGVNEWDGAS